MADFGGSNAHIRGEGDEFSKTYVVRRKQLQEQGNTLAKRPVPRIDDIVIRPRKAAARQSKYSPTKMKNEINGYFQWCEDTDNVPSIKGMMIHLKYHPQMFYKLIQNPAYQELFETARLIIQHYAEADVYATSGMAAGKIAYMKNVHGWADKLDTMNVHETRVMSTDEARAKLELLAPKLLELLNNPTVANQLAVQDAVVIEAKEVTQSEGESK